MTAKQAPFTIKPAAETAPGIAAAPEPFALIDGGPGADILPGTASNDTLNGLGGNDTISGLGGNDRVDGGAGVDDMDGGTGIDTLVYSTVSSYTTATTGWLIDLAAGTASNGIATERAVNFEAVVGSLFNDTIFGSAAANTFEGGAGNDRLEGRAGNDILRGGAGDDTLVGGLDTDRFDGNGGLDTVDFQDQATAIVGDLVAGTATSAGVVERIDNIENLVGTALNDRLLGSAGDNVLDGGPDGLDTIDGGAGVDTLSFLSSRRGVIIDLDAGASFDGQFAESFLGIENAIGSAFDDLIFASNARGQTISGGSGGADRLNGGPLTDTLSYAHNARAVIVDLSAGLAFDGAGLDTITGFEAVIGSALGDTIFATAAAERLDGGAGDDLIVGSGGNDTVLGGLGDDRFVAEGGTINFDGGDGVDTISYATSAAGITARLGSGTVIDGGATDTIFSVENLVGTAFSDRIDGSNVTNILDGGTDGADEFDGFGGVDTLTFASAARAVTLDVGAGTAADGVFTDRFSNMESYVGTRFNDTLIGGATPDVLDGGPGGADSIDGGEGVDTLSYASATRGVIVDLFVGLSFDGVNLDQLANLELVTGSAFDDTIFGSKNDDRFNGGGGNDRVQGDSGFDRLEGGQGTDTLNGGLGDDVFIMRRGGSQGDIVEDFAGLGAADGDRLFLVGWSTSTVVTLVDAATSTYRITDGIDGFSETIRVIGDYTIATDTFFG